MHTSKILSHDKRILVSLSSISYVALPLKPHFALHLSSLFFLHSSLSLFSFHFSLMEVDVLLLSHKHKTNSLTWLEKVFHHAPFLSSHFFISSFSSPLSLFPLLPLLYDGYYVAYKPITLLYIPFMFIEI